MTLTDNLITLRVYFQQGWAEIGTYMGLLTFGLMVTANLTLKGIYFPIWALLPIAIICLFVGIFVGWFLISHNIIKGSNSKINENNKEFIQLIKDVKEMKEIMKLKL